MSSSFLIHSSSSIDSIQQSLSKISPKLPPSTLPPPPSVPPPPLPITPTTSIATVRHNVLIHQLYTRNQSKECLELCEKALHETHGNAEYALYAKALLLRTQGQIRNAMHVWQAVMVLNPANKMAMKQVARSLEMMGKTQQAIDVYQEVMAMPDGNQDWEVHYGIGKCCMENKQYEQAEEEFKKARDMKRNDIIYVQLGKLYTRMEQYEKAIEMYLEALEYSPENVEMLLALGLIYLRLGNKYRAFDFIGNSLTYDPKNTNAILAAGSIIQEHNDTDVALVKYRVAAVHAPNSPQLWNNVGMCFFGKQKYVAAIACLKRAHYLDPFEWITAYNLGIVHLHMQQYASTFHYLSASINMKPNFASSYMYLGIALDRLDDFQNACAAYDKALSMESDYIAELNYAIMLNNHSETDQAKEHFLRFKELFSQLSEEDRNADADVTQQATLLSSLLVS